MSSLFSKSPVESVGPYLSFNSKVTESRELGHEPSSDEAQLMKVSDPKLDHTWAIWEQHKQSKENKSGYADSTKRTCAFSTVKEFWSCWNHLPQPSVLLDRQRFVRNNGDEQSKVDCLMVFRDGVQPEWEDPQNTNGGHFLLSLKSNLPPGQIDEVWNNVILGVISGAIEPADMITGVRLVDKLDARSKPHVRIELWFNEMDEDNSAGGRVYDLRGSFERCLRIGLDGKDKPVTWGRTDQKSHRK